MSDFLSAEQREKLDALNAEFAAYCEVKHVEWLASDATGRARLNREGSADFIEFLRKTDEILNIHAGKES